MKSFRTNNNQGPYILFLPGLRIQELRASKLKSAVKYKVNDVSDCLSKRIGGEFYQGNRYRTEAVET